eukprot:Amastigsp_a511886_79.p1 type:complete len:737 gc:universal Amastigsp_a511886_79:49-2259(+)
MAAARSTDTGAAAPSSATPFTSTGNVRIPVAEFLTLLDRASAGDGVVFQPPPVSFLMSRCVASGSAGATFASFELRFEIDVLSADSYVTVPLVPSTATLLAASVLYEPIGAGSDLEDDDASSVAGDGLTGGATVALTPSSSSYTFISKPSRPGRYTAQLEIQLAYSSIHNNMVALTVPVCTRNELRFSVPRADVTLSCEGALSTTTNRTASATQIVCVLAPSRTISLQWQIDDTSSRRRGGKEPAPVSAQLDAAALAPPELPKLKVVEDDPMVTVAQRLVCEIGEGVLALNAGLTFSLVATRREVFEVRVPPTLRVLDVSDSGSQIRAWEVVSVADANAARAAANLPPLRESKEPSAVLRVRLAYSVEESFTMRVSAEVELAGTSCDFAIPALRCVDVAREKGWIGVGPKTNVELDEVARAGVGLSKVDVNELPASLTSEATARLVLAYKFLSTAYQLDMRVTKHADVEVLVAAIEQCLVTAIVTAEGKLLYFVQINLRNTERQFLRVQLQPNVQIWSTVVAGEPVKPATDADGKLMIPLTKSGDEAVVVAFAFLVPDGVPMVGAGHTAVAVPTMDLPISHLFVSLALPSQYKYDEPTGGMRKASENRFSQNPYFSKAAPRAVEPTYGAGAVGHRFDRGRRSSIALNESMSSHSDDDEADDNCYYEQQMVKSERISSYKTASARNVRREAPGRSAGVIPVSIEMPRLDDASQILFERLLLSAHERIEPIVIPYRQK